MSLANDDIGLMEHLMSIGIDEIRAAYLIGEMNCPKCNTRLFPLFVTEIPENKHIHIGYVCSQCGRDLFYDATKKEWEASAPHGWTKNLLGINLRAQKERKS